MYDKSDPRASMIQNAAVAPLPTGLIAEVQVGHFDAQPPQIDDEQGRGWFLRGRNFIVAYGIARPGAMFERVGQVDEFALILPEPGQEAIVSTISESVSVRGNSVCFVPPGDSRIILPTGGTLVRLFTARSDDLVTLSGNSEAYSQPRSHIPDFQPWPEPKGGWKIRAYSLDAPPVPDRFGRIFRCTTFMINFLDPQIGPRDTSKLSPHHHDDFEQCSLALTGSFTHHLRWPWTIDMADWRDDQHVFCRSPSATIIPPPVIHTSRAMESGTNQLVDIFCPPRLDFSKKSGWVLNADDYPMPGE
jgi:hypothetical protein